MNLLVGSVKKYLLQNNNYMRYIFKNKEDAFDKGRAGFANSVCKLIYNQSGNDIEKAIKNGESIFTDFNEYVRNIYELVDSYIPLIAYYELKKHGADNYGFSEEEYQEALNKTKAGCEKYYN